MKIMIKNHNKNILWKKQSVNTSTCSNKEACPLDGQYQIGEAVYDSTLLSNQPNDK